MYNNQTWVKHEVKEMSKDEKIQRCIHCNHIITDLSRVSFMSSNISRGFPEGTVYQLPGSGISQAVVPDNARRVMDCNVYYSARIEKAEDVNCNPDMKASHQKVNP
ncbi:MAG: hypothetical protein UZ05_CHB002000277 [Chlorobi bacterium OLB5]|nr:MAG: hypothetical protein UZ05_CHB002000277 [Chlorobi bacterium OLB5]